MRGLAWGVGASLVAAVACAAPERAPEAARESTPAAQTAALREPVPGAARVAEASPEPAAFLPPGTPGVDAHVWVRPDRRFSVRKTCTPAVPPETIARTGGIVLYGSSQDVSVTPPEMRSPQRCVAFTHEANRAFADRVRALRRAGDPPLVFIELARFDLVTPRLAALPGFEPGFLLRSRRSWDEAQKLFASDTSADCAGGCRLLSHPPGRAAFDLPALLDALGGAGTRQWPVYYLSRSLPGRRDVWPLAAVADLRNPHYRAWRVAEARRAMQLGGYDALMLNQKFPQYRKRGQWVGSPRVEDVTVAGQIHDTFWTGEPIGYGYPEYVSGWVALGHDLRAAGVPYAVWVGASVFSPGRFDDPSTPGVDEGELIRETARGARYVILRNQVSDAQLARIRSELLAVGVKAVVRGGPESRPQPRAPRRRR